jgi:hypothetical protein
MKHQACHPLLFCNQVDTLLFRRRRSMTDRTPAACGTMFRTGQNDIFILVAGYRAKRSGMLRFACLILQCVTFMVETRGDGFASLQWWPRPQDNNILDQPDHLQALRDAFDDDAPPAPQNLALMLAKIILPSES